MGESDVLGKTMVRQVTGVFASRTAASPAVDDLLIAGFDRADIDVLADGQQPQGVNQAAIPAVELADVPVAPRQVFVTPEDTAGVFAVCVAVTGSLGAMIGAIGVIAPGSTTWPGWRWKEAPQCPAASDGFVLWGPGTRSVGFRPNFCT